ncbi:MAG TPA: glycosyltransferase family 4 protein [Gemmatimonadaceae bacterium]|nr:glycosyltransferase family 4 protein [Gemmatimonadaceae bacterium]
MPPSPLPLETNGASPLRIALVTEYYYPHLGGVCEHVHFFARVARQLGHHVDIITSWIPGTAPRPNVVQLGRSVPWYINGSQSRLTVGRTLRRDMRHALRDGNYDIVHVHSPLTPVLPLLAIAEAEVPVVGTFHTYFDYSVGYRTFQRAFQKRLNKLSAAIAVSQSTIVALERYFDADWKIIPNGIDTDLFRPDAARPPEIRGDVPAILFLGRFDPRNGLSTLIDAFKRVKGRGRRAQLVVVGDGPLRRHYYRQAANDPDITFVGAVLKGRPGYYANSAMYACPTTKASFGITLLESMACAAPIVCSDILGFRDVVVHGREALMVPRDDHDALANGLVHLLDNESLRARLGETGRRRAAEYDWRRVSAQVLEVYDDVLGRTRVPALS